MPARRREPSLLNTALNSFIFRRLPGVLLGLLIGFGILMTASAQEPEACLLGLFQCDENGLVWSVEPQGEDQMAQVGPNAGLDELLLRLGFFLNLRVMPLLFGIASLLFLYYLARFFIIDAANNDTREEARRRALWGFAAFILIVSIWGIVNLLVSGLIGTNVDQSICPDYLGGRCGDLE
jgi:hypothetical protein